MYRQKLCMGVTPSLGIDPTEQIKLIAKVGFEAVFSGWDHGVPLESYKKAADEYGLIFQSVHAPFHNKADVSKMWVPGEDGRIAAKELCQCLEVCADNEIEIMVSHVYIGFNYELPDEATQAVGLENFGTVANRARELGVTVAFENTEGEEFLHTLMEGLKSNPAVGFCLDTGHEQCYNRGMDMLALYGDRLVATHINDNLGISSFDGITSPRDDLHLLPFDGIIDWQKLAARLDSCDYRGIMTYELKRQHRNYAAVSPELFISEAYKRACRVAALRTVGMI